jgi:hypothetical protein
MMTAYPGDRIGEHVILTVTEPVRYLILKHRTRSVHVPMGKVEALAQIDRETQHLGSYEFSWTERMAMEEGGLAITDIRGGLWPTLLLQQAMKKTV